MKIKVGDKVKFLNDTGSGEVTRIIDQLTAQVQIDGGFEVPWLISDLVVHEGSYSSDNDEIEIVSNEKKSFSEKIIEPETDLILEDEEIVLAFLPDSNSSEFEAYLINSSSYWLKYVISRKQEGELVLFHEGSLEPGLKVSLGNYLPGNLKADEMFYVQAVLFNKGFYKPLEPINSIIKIEAADMYDASLRKESDYFIEKVVLFSLYDWNSPIAKPEVKMDIDPEEIKKAMYTKGDIKAEKKVEIPKAKIVEVDLHIELLLDKYRHLSNGEIVAIQIARFRTALEGAILHKTRKIVFIHGVGNGKLKHEIRQILDTEYRSTVRYQDASFKEYGYGATMVLIK